MTINWRCDACGCIGSSLNRSASPDAAQMGRWARALHDAVSSECVSPEITATGEAALPPQEPTDTQGAMSRENWLRAQRDVAEERLQEHAPRVQKIIDIASEAWWRGRRSAHDGGEVDVRMMPNGPELKARCFSDVTEALQQPPATLHSTKDDNAKS